VSSIPLYTLNTLFLVGVAALLLGILLGGWMVRRPRIWPGNRSLQLREAELEAYRRGLDYVSEGKTDQAIREFSLVARMNPENTDVYVRLGQLYRAKGEAERALRIHESLTVRPEIPLGVKVKALLELAHDCRMLGYRERALSILERAASLDPTNREIYHAMLGLYQETGDWESAYEVQKKIYKMRGGGNGKILSHLKIEEGKVHLEQGRVKEALRCFKTAIALDKKCVEARLLFGDALERQGKNEKAIQAWEKVREADPSFMFLAFERMEKAYFELGRYNSMGEKYLDHLRRHPGDYCTRMALARLYQKKEMYEEAVREFQEVLNHQPTLVEAYRILHQTYLRDRRWQEASEETTRMLEILSAQEKRFGCSHCGYRSVAVFWKCPQCGRWDSVRLVDHGNAEVREDAGHGGG